MNPLIQFRTTALLPLIALLLACFELATSTHAVLPPPPPDGGYPGQNTAEGTNALFNLTTGTNNTAIGVGALFSNTTGVQDTATGSLALLSNTSGSANTADGFEALISNTTGFGNTGTGWSTLLHNTTGFHNTADGFQALLFTTTGNHNTATGDSALESNTTGNFNTVDGAHSLTLNTTGSGNAVLGFNAGNSITTASNVICIGENVAGANVSTSCFIGIIFGATATGGVAVFINSSGQLGTAPSSRRFKEGIKSMAQTSELVFALKPVTFHYKKEIDPAGTSQFGLVAEDVEKVNPDLVVRDKEGKPYSVRYDQVNAMLLNEFLKEHRKLQEQGATIVRLQKQIEGLSAGLQKVSEQLEVAKPIAQTVLNNQ
jgi:hypothetical protein